MSPGNGALQRPGAAAARAMADPATAPRSAVAARGRVLRRGMIVQTGSVVAMHYPKRGDTVTVAFDGLGEPTATFR
jgi:2-keto-4-pentenoate hydratase